MVCSIIPLSPVSFFTVCSLSLDCVSLCSTAGGRGEGRRRRRKVEEEDKICKERKKGDGEKSRRVEHVYSITFTLPSNRVQSSVPDPPF